MMPFNPLRENYSKVDKIFGREFLNSSHYDSLKLKQVLKANDELADHVYGKYSSLIKNHDVDLLEDLHDELLSDLFFFDFESYIDLDKLGVILVRPEVFNDREKYRAFLNKIKLNVIYEKKIRLSFIKYWMLYHEQMMEGLRVNDPLIDFPTRTFNYIYNDCYMFIVKGSEKLVLPTNNIAEYLFRYKGKHGYDIPNTLRGDIAYNSLSRFVDNGTTLKKIANIPLDPIGVYRALVRGQVYSDRSHEGANTPILFYGGQAVHIPDRSELNVDLNMFCDKEDIANLYLKIKKRD